MCGPAAGLIDRNILLVLFDLWHFWLFHTSELDILEAYYQMRSQD